MICGWECETPIAASSAFASLLRFRIPFAIGDLDVGCAVLVIRRLRSLQGRFEVTLATSTVLFLKAKAYNCVGPLVCDGARMLLDMSVWNGKSDTCRKPWA